MSHEERYGTAVWIALSDVFMDSDTTDDSWITVGQVARRANTTKPTAAKYLNKLVEKGEARRVCVGAGKSLVVGYRPNWGKG